MTEKTLFKDTDSPEFKAGIEEGIRRVFNLIQYTIANSDNDLYNEVRSDLAQDIIEYSPEYSGRWKEIEELRQTYVKMTNDAVAEAIKKTRKEVLKELSEMTIMRDVVFDVLKKCEFKSITSCCGVELKTCAGDVWKGDIGWFSSCLFKEALPKE